MSRFYQWWREWAKNLVATQTLVEIRRTTRTEITVEQQQTLWRVEECAAGPAAKCPHCGSTLPHPEVTGTRCPQMPDGQKPRLQRSQHQQ